MELSHLLYPTWLDTVYMPRPAYVIPLGSFDGQKLWDKTEALTKFSHAVVERDFNEQCADRFDGHLPQILTALKETHLPNFSIKLYDAIELMDELGDALDTAYLRTVGRRDQNDHVLIDCGELETEIDSVVDQWLDTYQSAGYFDSAALSGALPEGPEKDYFEQQYVDKGGLRGLVTWSKITEYILN